MCTVETKVTMNRCDKGSEEQLPRENSIVCSSGEILGKHNKRKERSTADQSKEEEAAVRKRSVERRQRVVAG